MKKMYHLSALLLVLLFTCGIAFAQTDTLYVSALEQYEKGNFTEAIKYLKEFVSRRPEPSAYYLIGYALYKQKKFDEAEEYFKQAYLIEPNFSPRSLEYFAKQSPEEMEALERFARPSEEPESETTMPVETAPPVVMAEPEPTPIPETAAPPTVAQTAPQQGEIAQQEAAQPQAETTPQQPAPRQVTPAPQPSAPQQVQPPPSQTRPYTPPRAQQRPGKQIAPSFIAMFLGGFMLVGGIVGAVLYLFFAFCLFKIGKKLDVEMAWLAFIPIVQVWVFVASAGKPWWWILLLFIPVINLIIGIYLWMCIAENLGKSKWLGILMILPLINLVMLAVFAFSKGAAGSMGELSDFEGASFDDSDLSSFVPPADEEDEDTF